MVPGINEIIKTKDNIYQFKKGILGKNCSKCCFHFEEDFSPCKLWNNIKTFDCAHNLRIKGYFIKL